jgi:serine protease
MNNPAIPRGPSLLAPLCATLVLASCGGGGGGGAPVQTGANVQGQLRVPALGARLQAEFDLRPPMIAGEVVVWLADPAAPPPDLSAQGLELLRAPGGPIAVYRAVASAGRARFAEGAAAEDSAEHATCRAAAGLAEVDAVASASPNWLYRASVQPNDVHFGKQWHLPQINLPPAWDLTQGSANVIVAVLDTGIVSAHPEFAGRLIPGFDMVSNPTAARDGDGRDPNPEDPGDLATQQGSSFHGTHVAGTIGANGNDGQGVAGVDWRCKLMPVRVLGRGGGSVEDIANGILFAAGLPNGSGQLPARRADIVNMSLGGPGQSAVLEQACNQAANAGVLLIAAAGNDDSDQPNSPASIDSVLSVGAVDIQRARAPYSNFHVSIDLWAPGGDMSADRNGDQLPDGVLSCMADDQGNLFLQFENGTSMAAPHVAGVAALIKAANPALGADQIRQVLLANTQPGTALPNNGRLLDALAAVQAATGNPPTQAVLVALPSVVDFGSDRTTARVDLANRGAGTLTFDTYSFTPAAPWLAGVLDPSPGTNISDRGVDFRVDRTGLPNGVLQTRLVLGFRDEQNQPVEVAIDLRMRVGPPPANQDDVFVLLVDADTLATRYQAQTNAAAGFRFTLPELAAGRYLLVAGTDRNNNDFLGDDGEAFGAWPSLDAPLAVPIAQGQRLQNMDFAIEELVVIQQVSGARRSTGVPIRRLP